MRFDYLNLRAFGHFTDYEVLFKEDKNFHLLYGPNEAGKSTILRSVVNFLYGFPQQTADSFLHSNQKLRIEGQLKKTNGETLQYIRRKGRKNTVLDIDNNAINEKEVNSFLNGISEEHFINMFALDHIRLREGGESLLQNDGNAGESLFSAASGISILRHVLEELDGKARSLYLKGGSRTINQAIKQEKEKTKEIATNQLKIQEWQELERTYFAGKKEIETLLADIKQISSEEQKYHRLKQTLPKIALRKELIEKRDALGFVPNLPENGEEDRKECQQQIAAANKSKEKAEINRKEFENQLNSISIPKGILNQAAEIESLYREIDSYKKDVKQLPELEGKRKQLEERVLSTLKEIDASNQDVSNVEGYRLSVEKKKTIRELCDQKPLLDKDVTTATNDFAEIETTIKKQTKELNEVGEVPDIEELEYVINMVKSEGKIEGSLKEKQAAVKQMKKELEDAIHSLPLWEGTSDELLQVEVPNLTETVKKYQKQRQNHAIELQKAKEKIDEENLFIEANEKRIRDLESLADIPTEDMLAQLRNHRDSGWLLIRKKLNNDPLDDSKLEKFTNDLPVDMVFENSIRKTDDVADRMRREAEKLGEKNKLLSDIEMSKKKIKTLTEDMNQIEKNINQWENEWKSLWKPAEIEPLTPDEMLEWLERYENILTLHHNLETTLSQLNELEEKHNELKLSLETTLTALEPLKNGLTLEALLNKAENTSKRLTDQLHERNTLLVTITSLQEKLETAQINKQKALRESGEWVTAWKTVLNELPVSAETSSTVVKELLDTYDSCVYSFDECKQVEKNIESIQSRIYGFEERVKSLKQNLVTDFIENTMDIAVKDIYEALQKAGKDQGTIENIEQQIKREERDKEKSEREINEANLYLEKLIAQAECTTLEELEEIEVTFKQKMDYTGKIEELEEQLVELGNGQTLHELFEEAEEVETDAIEIELKELTRKRNDLDQTRSQLEQAHGVVKKEYNEKIAGANDASVQAEEEKQSILAKISNDTDQYITHKLASLLLKKGIEFYREKNQSPIIQRASEIFNRLTLGSFEGITVEFDAKDEPVIMGVRNHDEKVDISGMSDGTTDQLYLSLRIASIEKYVKENEPMPFIVDDILVHFDDERSKETLKVLLELSKITQVIFFTHHYRLAGLMSEVASDMAYQLEKIGENELVEVY
ncbi:YhaN family protein [Alteribacter populi]|uniref:YhaN family protein n=1 Tax=Alteribacter populi TaxID=2011011 RepID=UPI000BBB22FC|nr:YhaN family protein [Alteribacter populi]